MNHRIKEIYEGTKQEIVNGANIYEYISIMYGLIKLEDYEALEGIRLALCDLGLKFRIPESDDELDEYMDFMNNQNDNNEVRSTARD